MENVSSLRTSSLAAANESSNIDNNQNAGFRAQADGADAAAANRKPVRRPPPSVTASPRFSRAQTPEANDAQAPASYNPFSSVPNAPAPSYQPNHAPTAQAFEMASRLEEGHLENAGQDDQNNAPASANVMNTLRHHADVVKNHPTAASGLVGLSLLLGIIGAAKR